MFRVTTVFAILCLICITLAANAADGPSLLSQDLSNTVVTRPFASQYSLGKDWTASVDALFLSRSNPGSRTLVTDSFRTDGNELINAADFSFGSESGYQMSLMWRGLHSTRMAVELKYFSVGDWGSDIPVFNAPGGAVVRFSDPIGNNGFPADLSASYASRLRSFELGIWHTLTPRLNVLLGYRRMNLGEELTITQDIGPGLNMASYLITANNRLKGLQIGAAWNCLHNRRLDVDVIGKLAALSNDASNSAGITQQVGDNYVSSAVDSRTAYLTELNVNGSYALSRSWGLRAGYQWLRLRNVALAPQQLGVSEPIGGTANVDTTGRVTFDGGYVGLDYNF